MQFMILSLTQCNLIDFRLCCETASLLLILCSVNDIRLSLGIHLKETENKNKSITYCEQE